jgi:hypothetical protein
MTTPEPNDTDTTEDEVATRALAKLRDFVATLEPAERSVVAALLAPGVANAYAEPEEEVVAFSAQRWTPERLPASLAEQVRGRRVRVEFD